jgi:hypothetical protein
MYKWEVSLLAALVASSVAKSFFSISYTTTLSWSIVGHNIKSAVLALIWIFPYEVT